MSHSLRTALVAPTLFITCSAAAETADINSWQADATVVANASKRAGSNFEESKVDDDTLFDPLDAADGTRETRDTGLHAAMKSSVNSAHRFTAAHPPANRRTVASRSLRKTHKTWKTAPHGSSSRSVSTRLMPTLEQPLMTLLKGRVGYHIRRGRHAMTNYDWSQFLNFAARKLHPSIN